MREPMGRSVASQLFGGLLVVAFLLGACSHRGAWDMIDEVRSGSEERGTGTPSEQPDRDVDSAPPLPPEPSPPSPPLGPTGLLQQARWIAYNDLTGGAVAEALGAAPPAVPIYRTRFHATGAGNGPVNSGQLVNSATGEPIGITVTVRGGNVAAWDGGTSVQAPESQSAAQQFFGGFANWSRVVRYDVSEEAARVGWWYEIELTGLKPNAYYALVTTANRGGLGDPDAEQKPYNPRRRTRFTISDEASNPPSEAFRFVNVSSTGVEAEASDLSPSEQRSLILDSGNNEGGLVVAWTNIRSPNRNRVVVRSENLGRPDAPNAGYQSYGMQMFALIELRVE